MVKFTRRVNGFREVDTSREAHIDFKAHGKTVSFSLFDVYEGIANPDSIAKAMNVDKHLFGISHSDMNERIEKHKKMKIDPFSEDKSNPLLRFSNFWLDRIRIARQLHVWMDHSVPKVK